MTKTLLIDADVLFYLFAHRNEYIIQWPEGDSSRFIDEGIATAEFEDFIFGLLEKLECSEYFLCVSSDYNFRYKVLPTYKHNRTDLVKPELWQVLYDHAHAHHPIKTIMWLEADDVMGVLGSKDPDKYIVASIDKDLKTVPCTLYNWNHDKKPRLISQEEADRWFYMQAVAGDPTDGYSGCPDIGMGKAEVIVSDLVKLVPYEHTFKRGKRKGETETRFMKETADSVWEAIVSHYEAKGLNESFAIRQAQVARILRVEDYDFEKKEPILWKP